MPANKRPRKAYRPKHARTDIATFLFDGDEPLDSGLRTSILTAVHAAALSLSRGTNEKHAWHTVVNALNIAQILCERAGSREIGLRVVYEAQNAMIAIAERFHATARLVFAGDELQAVNSGIELFEQLVETVSKRQYTAAAGETVRRRDMGAVVKIKQGGQTRRFQLEHAR